jgi:RecA/RadA recombinase
MSLNHKLVSREGSAPSKSKPSESPFIDALTVQRRALRKPRIRTGIAELDGLLRGGVELGVFSLFYGSRRVNRLLLQLAISAQLPPNYGGVNSLVIFVDGSTMFNPFEVASIARRYGIDPNRALNNIHVVRAFNFPMLVDVLANHLPQKIASLLETPKLILISGVASSSIHDANTETALGNYSRAIGWIRSLAMEQDIAVVASAPVASNSQWKPAGGTILQHTTQVHVYVHEKQDRVEYLLAKHPSRPPRKTIQWAISPCLTNYTLDMFMDDKGSTVSSKEVK